jgi:hypothetical protein
VLSATSQAPIIQSVTKQQLLLFGKVARSPDHSLLRSSTFCPGSLRPATDRYVRRRGRPRLEWASEVQKIARQLTSSADCLEELVTDTKTWRSIVNDL